MRASRNPTWIWIVLTGAALVCILGAIASAAETAPPADGVPKASPAGLPVSLDAVPLCPRPLSMVKIPAGKTTYNGKEVEVKSIWISMTETTWDHYDPFWMCKDMTIAEAVAAKDKKTRPTNPYSVPDCQLGHEAHGVISVSLFAGYEFCKWLSAKTGKKYRLPTEAEWEYACRAGGAAKLDAEALKKVAWFDDNSANDVGDVVPHPVASKQPNAWGLYDMLGNVGEWVAGPDGKPVLKGGRYRDPIEKVNATAREPFTKEWQTRDCQLPKSKWWLSDAPFAGFRIVRED